VTECGSHFANTQAGKADGDVEWRAEKGRDTGSTYSALGRLIKFYDFKQNRFQ